MVSFELFRHFVPKPNDVEGLPKLIACGNKL